MRHRTCRAGCWGCRTGRSTGCSGTCGPTTSSCSSPSSSPGRSAAGGYARSGWRAVAALVGGLAFALAPYRVGQSTGHLLGLIAFLLPATLLALERRRLVWAGIALTAVPLSGQIHLAMGAVLLSAGYAWARLPRGDWWKAAAGALAASAVAVLVEQLVVADSIVGAGRPFAQVRFYSAELADLVHAQCDARHREVRLSRLVDAGARARRALGRAAPAAASPGSSASPRCSPACSRLGSNIPVYEPLWRAFRRSGSRACRSG